jgi:pimeloyl-ACP methyl ester carboxylesterase
MRDSMVLHDQLIEAAVEENSGTVVRPRGEGDSRFAVFRRASDAVAAAAQIVGVIEDTTWHTPVPVQVRVGVHTGEADLRDGDYYGTAVNLCARVRGLAGPNQVFVSEATGHLLMRSDSGVELHDAGAHQLKGIARPERVYSLGLRPGQDQTGTSTKKRAPSFRAPNRRIATTWWRRRRGRIVVGVTVIVVLIVGGVIVARASSKNGPTTISPPAMPHGYTPRLTAARCPSGISSAIATARCSFLIVPQDRRHPDVGPKVRVAITIVPPLAGATPGAPPTIDIGGYDSLVDSPARSRSEYILVQPRGNAPDTPVLSCPEVEDATRASLVKPTGDVAATDAITAAYAACYQRSIKAGVNPSDYNYDTMADDLVDLMAVLRIGQVNIVTGDNYSHIAFGLLEKAPGAVRTLTLDNPEPAGASSYTDPVADLAASIQHYVSLCEADAQCSSAFPDLTSTFEAQVRSFTASPVLAQTDNEAFGSDSNTPGGFTAAPRLTVSVLIDGDRLAQASQEAIGAYTSSFFPILAAGIYNPPPNLVADLVDNYAGTSMYPTNGVFTPYPFGTIASLNCSYDIHVLGRGATISAEQLPAFAGVAVGQTLNQICAVWKVASVPDFYFTGVASAVPTLIVRGSLSPYGNDSFPNQVKQSLSSAKVGLFSTIGEDVLGEAPPCLDKLRREFLANPAAHLTMAACTAQSPPISFVDTP